MKDLTVLADETLVKLYEAGNNEAFEVLLMRHKDRIYNYILFITKNNSLAEDIFQETFIKAIMTIRKGRYTENGRFLAWISRIAHNLIIDYYRRQTYENTYSNDNCDYDMLNDARLCEDSIEDLMVKEQQISELVGLIQELPHSQREVLVMRIYKNMSFSEIADKMGVSINTSLGRMRYAVLNLKKMAKDRMLISDF